MTNSDLEDRLGKVNYNQNDNSSFLSDEKENNLAKRAVGEIERGGSLLDNSRDSDNILF